MPVLCGRMSATNVVCFFPVCGFVGRGSTQSNARLNLKGHTLCQHGAQFVGEGLPLAVPSSSELAAQLERFQRQQANLGTRCPLACPLQRSAAIGVVGGAQTGSCAGHVSPPYTFGTESSISWVHSGPPAGNVTPIGT